MAFMQLDERGLVSLDDPQVIENLLPELAAQKVLTGLNDGKSPIFEDRKRDITPRMLMNHTYGGGHSCFNPLLFEYLGGASNAVNEATDPHQTALDSPLLWQPGTHTNYGQGFDWLAVLIERLTKTSLDKHLSENIFAPLGLRDIGFEDTFGGNITSRESSKGKFWPRNMRQPDGTIVPIDPPVLVNPERPLAYPKGKYHTFPLGTGLAATASEVARLHTIMLPENAGVDPVTGHRLLAASSVKEISSPQLSEALRNDTRFTDSSIDMMFKVADLAAPHVDPAGTYGLGCAIQGVDRVLKDGRKGRSKGSVYWYGAANTEFWIDGEKGIVVFVNGNYLPWNDEAWLDFVAGVEGLLYEGLA
ncbi:beta-lactamase/transpeptidase-like protein [Polyplosphaeria fusca]|uniref:Beta-lactamase/transpeptidase-like protein n=1 Tax=Polyplosphaeria fusca TaxID=682080 RepID=A0A9P4R753_9PLEO|nr:beta-lactamase/transpeptidase-like protein [Polyplosphaeria fusca]